MKFTCIVEIDANIDKVVSVFSDPNSLEHIQEGFISKTLISGNEGEKDAQSLMKYKKFDLTETIINNNLPKEFKALYEHKHMVNTMRVKFISLNENKTRYDSEIHYTEFKGFMIKLMAKLFPSMFKKQVLKWMNLFKDYVEKQ